MSYDATWGFQNNFNEYGQEIKIIPKEKEEDLNRAFNDFLVDFTFILNKNGYEHYQLEIIDDYEEESVRKIALYFLKNTPKALTAISDLKCLDIYIPIGQKLNFTKFISNVQIDLGLSISYKQIDSDPFYCVNSLASAVKLLIENYLHSRNWISLYESGQSSMFWGLRYPSSSSVFHAVSVINVACSSQSKDFIDLI